jgi:3-oxoadipate enol-lactonase
MAEQHFIEVGGNKLHAVIDGPADRPWLTCLHTLASNLHLWDDQAPELAKSFGTLRLDARGHGQSTADNPAGSLEELAADVAAVWDAFGIERSDILGISLGGMTGVGLALDYPDRVGKLIAADCRLDAPGSSSTCGRSGRDSSTRSAAERLRTPRCRSGSLRGPARNAPTS